MLGLRVGVPTWRLLPSGGAADLVIDGAEEVGIVRVEPCVPNCVGGRALCLHDGVGVEWVTGSGGCGKRVRLNRKLQHTF